MLQRLQFATGLQDCRHHSGASSSKRVGACLGVEISVGRKEVRTLADLKRRRVGVAGGISSAHACFAVKAIHGAGLRA
jgi:hypothetical protein